METAVPYSARALCMAPLKSISSKTAGIRILMSKTTHQGAPGTENCPESEEIFNAEITVKLAQNPKRDIASPDKDNLPYTY